jgi:hypothetical protein
MRLDSLCIPLLALAAACGGDDDDDGIDAGDETIDAAPGTGSDAAQDGPDGSTTAELCGGFLGLQCEDPDDYCDYEEDTCGDGDTSGACTPRPAECDPGGRRVCGCDGQPYDNECEAAMAGQDVSAETSCG